MLPLSGLHVPDGVGSQHHHHHHHCLVLLHVQDKGQPTTTASNNHYHHLCHHHHFDHKIVHYMIFTARPDDRNPYFRDHLYPLPLLALQRARGQLGIFNASTGLSCNQKITSKSRIMIWWICKKWLHLKCQLHKNLIAGLCHCPEVSASVDQYPGGLKLSLSSLFFLFFVLIWHIFVSFRSTWRTSDQSC